MRKGLVAVLILIIALALLVITPIQASRISFNYRKPLGRFSRFLEVEFIGDGIRESFIGEDVIDLKALPPGTYYVIARWMGVEVGRWVISLDRGNQVLNLDLAMTDLSLRVVDLDGRVLQNFMVEIDPNVYGELRSVGGMITIRAVPTNINYIFKVSWRSPTYGTISSTELSMLPSEVGGLEEIALPVGDVRIRVVDPMGRPISGATVSLAGIEAKTDASGEVVYSQVPLEVNGSPISYELKVSRDGEVIYSGVIEVSRVKTSLVVMAELYDLKIRVEGAMDQPLPYARITLKRSGVELGTYNADEGGYLIIPDLPLSDYTADAEWKGFKGSTTITKDDLRAGRVAIIKLPPYTEILGIPLTFSSLIILVLGIIVGIILIVIGLMEYMMWRGRRLGVYPPKK